MRGEFRSEAIRGLWVRAINKVISQQRIVNLMKKRVTESKEKANKGKIVETYCLIIPTSKFKLTWTLTVIFLLLNTAIMTPFIISFIENMSYQLFIIEIFVDSMFFIDILFNFLTPYEKNDKLITNKYLIAKNYASGWLFPDLLACFPFWLFEDSSSGTM